MVEIGALLSALPGTMYVLGLARLMAEQQVPNCCTTIDFTTSAVAVSLIARLQHRYYVYFELQKPTRRAVSGALPSAKLIPCGDSQLSSPYRSFIKRIVKPLIRKQKTTH